MVRDLFGIADNAFEHRYRAIEDSIDKNRYKVSVSKRNWKESEHDQGRDVLHIFDTTLNDTIACIYIWAHDKMPNGVYYELTIIPDGCEARHVLQSLAGLCYWVRLCFVDNKWDERQDEFYW